MRRRELLVLLGGASRYPLLRRGRRIGTAAEGALDPRAQAPDEPTDEAGNDEQSARFGEVRYSLEHVAWIVPKAAEADIAVSTKQATHLVGCMTMIDVEHLRRPDLADGANAVLPCQQSLEIPRAQAVAARGRETQVLSAVDVLPALHFIDLFGVALLPLAIRGKLSRSILRVLCISFPGELGWGGHLFARSFSLVSDRAAPQPARASASRCGARKTRRARRRAWGGPGARWRRRLREAGQAAARAWQPPAPVRCGEGPRSASERLSTRDFGDYAKDIGFALHVKWQDCGGQIYAHTKPTHRFAPVVGAVAGASPATCRRGDRMRARAHIVARRRRGRPQWSRAGPSRP